MSPQLPTITTIQAIGLTLIIPALAGGRDIIVAGIDMVLGGVVVGDIMAAGVMAALMVVAITGVVNLHFFSTRDTGLL
jgi:hypothetical protein